MRENEAFFFGVRSWLLKHLEYDIFFSELLHINRSKLDVFSLGGILVVHARQAEAVERVLCAPFW